MRWLAGDGPPGRGPAAFAATPFLRQLAAMLDVADGDWRGLSRDAASIDRAGDPHATLLRILGLHPSSVEFHQRYAESLQQLFNELNLSGLGGLLAEGLVAAGLERQAEELLRRPRPRPPPRPAMLDPSFLRGRTV